MSLGVFIRNALFIQLLFLRAIAFPVLKPKGDGAFNKGLINGKNQNCGNSGSHYSFGLESSHQSKSASCLSRGRGHVSLSMSSNGDDESLTPNPYYQGMDAYAILSISKTASKKEIKSAYRKAVAKFHPDRFPNDEEKKKEGGLRMEKINRAYYVLEDEDRRRRYDLYGEQGVGTSASSEARLKQNADNIYGSGSSSSSSSSSASSSSSSSSSWSYDQRHDETYRPEDDPFVWDKFRKESAQKRAAKHREDKDAEDPYRQPQRQKSADNNGEDWDDEWWKRDRQESGNADGPRRPSWGSSHVDYDEYDARYDDYSSGVGNEGSDVQEKDVLFPDSSSSYEDIMRFLQKTGGFGGFSGSSNVATMNAKRMYDDDLTVSSPQLDVLRNKKKRLVAEKASLNQNLSEDGTDWGEVNDPEAIRQRLKDMDRVQNIDQEILEVEDEIEDAIMRRRTKSSSFSSAGSAFANDRLNRVANGKNSYDAYDVWGDDLPKGTDAIDAMSDESPMPRGVTARMNGAKSSGASNTAKGKPKEKKSVASRRSTTAGKTMRKSSSTYRSQRPPPPQKVKDLWSDEGFFDEAEDLENLFDFSDSSNDESGRERGGPGRDDRPNSSLYEDELFGDFDLESDKEAEGRTWKSDYKMRRGTSMSLSSDSPSNEIDELYNQLHRKRKL